MVIDERYCAIRKDTVTLPSGQVIGDYYLAVRPDIVVILAISVEGAIPLVRQYKHGAGQVTLELPAGTLDAAEDPVAAGRRELVEETGWTADELVCVGEFFDDASKNTNMVHCLVGRHANPGAAPIPEENEILAGLEVVDVQLDKLLNLITSGQIQAQSSVACAYHALAWLGRGGGPPKYRHAPVQPVTP